MSLYEIIKKQLTDKYDSKYNTIYSMCAGAGLIAQTTTTY
tara:strand:- start:465 stop:584 length:120 start_codon:yes stop_codon:yes gene_type:complete